MTSKQPHVPLRVGLVLATSTGGVGTHVASLAAYLLERDYHVTVCGPSTTDELFGFAARGATFKAIEIPASPSPLRTLVAMFQLRRAVRDVDVVHAHGLRAGFVAAASRRKPLVVTWHNLLLTQGAPGRRPPQLEQLLARRANIAIGVSEDLVARVTQFGARDARFIPVAAVPLAPPRRSTAQVRAELDATDRPLVLSVARLHPQKSLDVLITAAARWKSRDSVPLVVIAGDGPQRKELAALIDRLDAPVRLMGHRDDIADLLAACDVAVLASQWEGSPLFAQEALRAQKPLVVSDAGGLPELVADAAMLVPAGDVDALGQAVVTLLDDRAAAAQLSRRAGRRAAQLPDETECNAQVVELYEQLAKRS